MPVFHSSNMRQQFRCRCCVFRILHIPEEFKRLYHLISLALFAFLCMFARSFSLFWYPFFLYFFCSLGHARSHWQCVSKISEAFLLARRKVFDVCIAMASIYRFKKGLWIVFFRLRSIGMRVFFYWCSRALKSTICYLIGVHILFGALVVSKTRFSIE